MPRRSPRGNRARIEAELSPAQLATIEEACLLFGVRRERWQRLEALAVAMETAACCRLAERLQAERALSWSRAIVGAAVQLGLEPDTIRGRVAAWRRANRGATAA